MIKITHRPCGEDFERWKKKAENVRAEDIKSWQAGIIPDPRRTIWKELKDIFLEKAFCNKCAYCEGRYCAGHSSHVEHYRPKLAVTEHRQRIEHCGYFWLAYEWHNLLLACEHCNSNHGKKNEFRIAGTRVAKPDQNTSDWLDTLQSEKPLLLNPYFDDPEEHIDFDENGVPYPKNGSERGRETIEVCDLWRENLNEERRDVSRKALYRAWIELLNQKVKDKPLPSSEPFSSWLNTCAKRKVQEILDAFQKNQAHHVESDT